MVLAVSLGLVPWPVSPAVAQEPPAAECPTIPPALDPEADPAPDPLLVELRELRRDTATSCIRLAADLADVESAAGDPVVIDGTVPVSLGSPVELLAGTAESPLHVDLPADALGPLELDETTTDELVAASAAGTDVLHGDLWAALGLGCTLLFGYGLFRTVMPRA